jgi:hypothetical protein
MTDTTTIVDTYIASWNERDPEARLALVAATFADDADYLDPLMNGRGIEEIDAMIAAAQQQFPGHVFTLVAGPDQHNDRIRFSWLLAPRDGEAVAGGTDFAQLAGDGRLRSVTGFLDPVA